ncbi:MAG: hypothetical protein U0V70_05935 [Terriglobia bacterium]
MYKHCPSCHQLLDESVQICPSCGAFVADVPSLNAPIRIAEDQLPPPLIPEETGSDVPPQSFSHQLTPAGAAPNLLKPSFLGGIVLGVLCAVPFINCCCFLWVGGAGVLAVYLLRQEFGGEISPGLGAKLGFFTGMLGALFWQVIELPIAYIKSPETARQLQELLKTQNIPSEFLPFVEKILEIARDPFNPLILLFGISFKLLACGILTTLGGVLGAGLFNKRNPSNH